MALATAVSIWGPRAARTAATSFFCLICLEATAARRWVSASAAAACCCVKVDTEVVVVWPARALDTDCVIEGVRAAMICCTTAASLTDEEEDDCCCWAFIVVSLFWLLPWKLLPWKLEVVVLLPCSAVAGSTADVMEGPRALRTDSTTCPWLKRLRPWKLPEQ